MGFSGSISGKQKKKNATFKRGEKTQQQWPDTDRECSFQPFWTDRGQQLTSVCSQKQNKQEVYLGSKQMAVVWARTPIKSRSDATGKVTETQMYDYDVAQLRLRPWQAALTESFNNCQGRSKVAENNNDPKTEQIPSKPLHSRQDVHLVTSVTTADCQGSSAHAAISVHLHTLH